MFSFVPNPYFSKGKKNPNGPKALIQDNLNIINRITVPLDEALILAELAANHCTHQTCYGLLLKNIFLQGLQAEPIINAEVIENVINGDEFNQEQEKGFEQKEEEEEEEEELWYKEKEDLKKEKEIVGGKKKKRKQKEEEKEGETKNTSKSESDDTESKKKKRKKDSDIQSLASESSLSSLKNKKKEKKNRRLEEQNKPKISEWQSKVFQLKYVPFAKMLLKNLIIFGYAVYRIVRRVVPSIHPTRPVDYPVVLHRRFYELHKIIEDDGEPIYQVYGIKCLGNATQLGPEPDPDLHVFVMPGYEPDDATGEHNSIVKATLNQCAYVSQYKQIHLKAAVQAAHPPVAYEYDPNTTVSGSGGGGAGIEEYANAALYNLSDVRDKQKQQYLKEGYEQSIHAKQVNTPITIRNNKIITDPNNGDGGGPELLQQTIEDNYIVLQPGLKVASAQPPIPVIPVDMPVLDQICRDEIAGSYNIPYSFVSVSGSKGNAAKAGGSSGGGSSNVNVDDKDTKTLAQTLNMWKQLLCEALTEVYLLINSTLNYRSDIKFNIPIIPTMSSFQLFQLESQDVIHSDTLKKHLVSIFGLDPADIHYGKNEHERAPVGGNENQSGPLMKMKLKVQNAEAIKLLAEAEKIKNGDEANPEVLENEMNIEKMKQETEKIKIQGALDIQRLKMEAEKQKVEFERQKLANQMDIERQNMDVMEKKHKMEMESKDKDIQVNKSKPTPSSSSSSSSQKPKKKKQKV